MSSFLLLKERLKKHVSREEMSFFLPKEWRWTRFILRFLRYALLVWRLETARNAILTKSLVFMCKLDFAVLVFLRKNMHQLVT
ncbi:unnamed protein product [Amoebophrya sp. A25]|nr:unnamed protein product [Amoebophrya sp. A25]|eukprot:GSA25T00026192001.1